MEKETMVQEQRRQMGDAVAQLKIATEKLASIGLAKAVVGVDKAWLALSDELWPPLKPKVDPVWLENHMRAVRALIDLYGSPTDVHAQTRYVIGVSFNSGGQLLIPNPCSIDTAEGKEHLQRLLQEVSLLKDDRRDE